MAVADSETVNVLLGDGTGGFAGDPEWPVLDTPTGTNPNSVGAGHLNGDAHLDLVTTNSDGSVSVLLGNGDGTFLPASDFATGASPLSVVVAHVNSDALPDLVTANLAGDSVSVLVADGAGFTVPVELAAGWGPSAVASADLNDDGRPDLTVANVMSDALPELGDPDPGPGTVSVLLNTSPGAPDAPTIVPGPTAIRMEGDTGTRVLNVKVLLSAPSAETVTVDWTTFYNSLWPWASAEPGVDYVAASGTVIFTPGQTAQTVPVTINGDTTYEDNEVVSVRFSNPTNATLSGELFGNIGWGNIANDD